MSNSFNSPGSVHCSHPSHSFMLGLIWNSSHWFFSSLVPLVLSFLVINHNRMVMPDTSGFPLTTLATCYRCKQVDFCKVVWLTSSIFSGLAYFGKGLRFCLVFVSHTDLARLENLQTFRLYLTPNTHTPIFTLFWFKQMETESSKVKYARFNLTAPAKSLPQSLTELYSRG